MANAQTTYRPDIDGLRTVAVFLVVFFHAFPDVVPGGYIGVDVFFVISGYLITQNILRDRSANQFSFRNFYARRFRRILPALLLVLLATWAFGWLALLGDELESLGRHVRAGSIFASNFQLFFESGYFDRSSDLKPLLHLWSLGVEEQYYLVYPLGLVLALRSRWSVLWWMGAVGVLSFALNVVLIRTNESFSFYFLPTRFWELLLGGALAAVPSPGRSSRCWSVVSVAGIATMILAALWLTPETRYPGAWALFPTLGSAACIYAGTAAAASRVLLANRGMATLGKTSYALYLWHWPILSFAAVTQEGRVEPWQDTVLVAVSVSLAFVTWRLFETRAHAYALPPSDPRRAIKVLWLGLAGLSGCFLLGSATVQQAGFPDRYPHLKPEPFASTTAHALCAERHSTGDGFCTESSAAPKIALIGDSHAEAFFSGLMAGMSSPVSRTLILLGGDSCPYLSDVTVDVDRDCADTNERVDRVLEQIPSVEVVVLFVRGPRYLIADDTFDIPLESDPEWPMRGLTAETASLPEAELMKAGLSGTLTKLERLRKKVVLVAPWPDFDFTPDVCLDRRPFRIWPVPRKEPCALPLTAVRARQEGYRAILRDLQIEHPRLVVIDPLPLLCDAEHCWAARGGQRLYRDGSHLNWRGVKLLEPTFAETVTGLVDGL